MARRDFRALIVNMWAVDQRHHHYLGFCKIQTLRPYSKPLSENLHFNEIPRCTLKFLKHSCTAHLVLTLIFPNKETDVQREQGWPQGQWQLVLEPRWELSPLILRPVPSAWHHPASRILDENDSLNFSRVMMATGEHQHLSWCGLSPKRFSSLLIPNTH